MLDPSTFKKGDVYYAKVRNTRRYIPATVDDNYPPHTLVHYYAAFFGRRKLRAITYDEIRKTWITQDQRDQMKRLFKQK